jgi:hypothetical protein
MSELAPLWALALVQGLWRKELPAAVVAPVWALVF